MKPALNQDELDRIRSRIARAEIGTSGEVVPYVVSRSDGYEVVLWRAAAAAATIFILTTLLIYLFYQGWSLGWLYSGIGLAVGLVFSCLFGLGLVLAIPSAFRAIAGRNLLKMRVRARAERAFIEEGVFQTKERTGILILVSLWERRIEVVADDGVTAAVPSESWNTVVNSIRIELQRGDLAEALVAGVDACGVILSQSGLTASPDDSNELEDDLRIGPDVRGPRDEVRGS